MASMRDIKRRKESISSTSQITKAMKLVSTVKLQKAKGRAEDAKPYFAKMYETVNSALANSGQLDHPCLRVPEEGEEVHKGVILISSNRGLAGGYNANVAKLVTKGDFTPEDTVIFPVGRKGQELIHSAGYECLGDYAEAMNHPLFQDAVEIGKAAFHAFEQGEIQELYLAYTIFENTVKHVPTLIKLLPVEPVSKQEESGARALMNYEPSEEVTLDYIIPLYVNSLIYGALIEAVASENGARMQAMDNATSNAEDMISSLELQYNRARQSSITQELTEIVAGASAIE